MHESAETVAAALEGYLKRHPHASDTAAGIARWWLGDALKVPPALVVEALELLIGRGAVVKHESNTGITTYQGNSAA